MKKILCVGYILYLVTVGTPSQATLLVYEGFGYPPFTDLDGASGSTGEIGFDGPWIDEGSGGTLEEFGHYIDIDDSILGNVYSDSQRTAFRIRLASWLANEETTTQPIDSLTLL